MIGDPRCRQCGHLRSAHTLYEGREATPWCRDCDGRCMGFTHRLGTTEEQSAAVDDLVLREALDDVREGTGS